MPPWEPTTFRRFERTIGSSTNVARIVTDAGSAHLKALNNPMGPGAIVRDWVGTKLAAWFGLPTFDIAIMQLDEFDEIPLVNGENACPGPALVSRTVRGHPWGGARKELAALVNPEDIPRLVVFDTWVRNRDRHPPPGMNWRPHHDNVFFSEDTEAEGQFQLVAMDHTECFAGTTRELRTAIDTIARVKDDRVYGLFPEFCDLVAVDDFEIVIQAAASLAEFDKESVIEILNELPDQWIEHPGAKGALESLVVGRAEYIAETAVDAVKTACANAQIELGIAGDQE